MAKVDVQDTSEDAVTTHEHAAVTHNEDTINIKSKKVKNRDLLEVLLVIVIILLGVWVWMLKQDNDQLSVDKQNVQSELAKVRENPQIAVEQQTKDLLNKVGSLMQLPKNETPTIATVSDAAKAKKQSAFFANAENGDKVLMYVKSGQAILYRPSTNKIVIVAPLTFSGNSTATTKDKTTN